MAEWSTTEWRESNSKHRTNITVARRTDDSLFETTRRLVHHGERKSALHFLTRCRRALRTAGIELVDALVHVPPLSLLVVLVKPLLSFAAKPARAQHLLQRRARLHPRAKRLGHDRPRLAGNVESNLINQVDWPHGESELPHRLVNRVNRDAFVEQNPSLVHVRRENAIHIEARRIVHDDHRLPNPATELHHRDDRLRRCCRRHDYLEQRHLVHGGEEVHPDHALRPLARRGYLRDGNRARVGREDRVGREHRFRLGEHRVLHLEIFKYRFDNKRESAEARVLHGA